MRHAVFEEVRHAIFKYMRHAIFEEVHHAIFKYICVMQSLKKCVTSLKTTAYALEPVGGQIIDGSQCT